MNYYFADTETTSTEPTATVCEVGWIRTDENFNILETVESIVDPVQMISPGASGTHGLTNKDCESFPTLKEFFTEQDSSCHGELLQGPAVVVGHRISFDMRFLAPYFTQAPQELCTLRWARNLYPHSDDHKLSTLIFALDLPRSAGAHRVLADVMSAYHLCRHICDRTGYTLPQLAEASKQPMKIATFPFGKHKGEAFSNVPRHYLRWAKENMKDLDMDMSYTIDLFLKQK